MTPADTLRAAVEALEMAHAGLEWYRDAQPDTVNGSDEEADEVIASALSLLRSALEGGEPEGWKLVPITPTMAMLDAADHKFQTARYSLAGFNARELAYKAMLDAAPPHGVDLPDGGQKNG